jgi:Thioesterase superfamily.
VVHGGIQASMLDEALGRAVMGTDPDSARLFYTAKMTITYRQHVPVEQTLRILGRVLKDRGRAVRSWAGIYNEADELLTEAEGLLLAVPEEEAREMDFEALGWQVYPLE